MVDFRLPFNVFGLVSGHLDGAVVSSSITPLHETETHKDWADARCARNFHCKDHFPFTLRLVFVDYKGSGCIQEESRSISWKDSPE